MWRSHSTQEKIDSNVDKKNCPALLQEQDKHIISLYWDLSLLNQAEGLTMPLAQMPNFEEVGNTPREGNEEHR